MTDVQELIDAFLADTRSQSLVDAGRIRDFLLDLRLLLVPEEDVPCPN